MDNSDFEKISPLGNRDGIGTFETFFVDDIIIIADFLKHKKTNDIYFGIKEKNDTDYKKYHKLNFQKFPFGVDVMDDSICCNLAEELLKEIK